MAQVETNSTEQAADSNIVTAQTRNMRKELVNVRDIEFLGDIYLGPPSSQVAKVVFDTGSDWLTIKSCLSEAHCHTKKVAQSLVQSNQ